MNQPSATTLAGFVVHLDGARVWWKGGGGEGKGGLVVVERCWISRHRALI